MARKTGSYNNKMKSAIVIGGGIAGLLVAQILTKYFDRVLIIERDELRLETRFRSGVPQGRHLHALLLRGANILDEMFPGFRQDLNAAGAVELDHGLDVLQLFKSGWSPQFRTNLIIQSLTRPLLESCIRRRVMANERIETIDRSSVTSLIVNDSGRKGRKVSGVVIQRKRCAERAASREEILQADFIVDASGRGSRAPEWIQAIGFPLPRQSTVNVYLGYTTRLYEMPTTANREWRALGIHPQPPLLSRGAALIPVEGHRLLLLLVGVQGDYPPTTDDGIDEFLRSIAHPVIHEVIRDINPLSPPYGYRRTDNRFIHYHEMPSWPDRFVVLGDAACTFNPIYGQGMTMAALGAVTLDEQLRMWLARRDGLLDGFGHLFQRSLATVTRKIWFYTTNEDMRWPSTEGRTSSFGQKLIYWYGDRLLSALRDPDVYLAMLKVSHMLIPPTALMEPRIMLRVLRASLSG